MIFFIIIACYILLADAVAKKGELRKIGYSFSFFISVLLTPIFGFLIVRKSELLNPCDRLENAEFSDNIAYQIGMTRVVRIILCINIIMFFFEVFASMNGHISIVEGICLNYGGGFAPYQFLTHLFLHAGISHICNNMYFLFICGPYLERKIGELKFLALYLGAGIFGSFLQLAANFQSGGKLLGASGCVFAVMTLYALTNNSSFIGAKWFKVRYSVIPGIIYELFTFLRVDDGIGHFSHIGGILVGVLFYIIFLWKRSRLKT